MSNLLNSRSGSLGALDDAEGSVDEAGTGRAAAGVVLISGDGGLTFALAKASSMFLDNVASRAAVAHLALHLRPPRRFLLALMRDLRCQSRSLQRFDCCSDVCRFANAWKRFSVEN
jgi:hypothetical protein